MAFEVVGRRRDDAHVDLDALGAADALELLIDQHAQDLVLRLARHLADLVEIEDAAMRFLQRADLARLAAACASVPNSSISMRSGVIVAAFSATNGPVGARRLARG